MRARAWVVVGVLCASVSLAAGAEAQTKFCKRVFACLDEPAPSPKPTPSPAPTAKPTPTPQKPPLACEGVGGAKTFEVGKERLLCFNVGPGSSPLVMVQSTNLANASCADLEMQLIPPSGWPRNYSNGPQPATVLPREQGQWMVWLNLTWAAKPACQRFEFAVRM